MPPGVPEAGLDRRAEAPAPYRADRLPLARKIATLAGTYRGREGLVIGIEGPWSAGKTAFAGHVLKELRADPATTVLPFNPWSLSNQNELVTELVSAVSGALASDVAEPSLSYGARLRATAARSLRLAAQPAAAARTAHEERGDIQQKLGSLEGRLVVLMEDIDRLDHDQTRLVMKLVRIAASLPNLVLLLVYDRPRVAASLDEEGRGGDDVLKTLVHIAFTLPEPSRQELNSVLFMQLQEAVSRASGAARDCDADERWRELVHGKFPPLFANVSDIIGFSSSLRLAWSAVGIDSVNMTDFAGIEAIRFFAPQLYASMATNRSLLTGGWRDGSDEAVERKSRYEDLFRDAPQDVRGGLEAVVRYLFPRLGAGDSTPEHHDASLGEKRVCVKELFSHYFQLGIPAQRVSETEVLFLRRRFGSAEAVAGLMREYLADGRLAPLLALIPTQSRIVTESDARALLLGLWTLEPELEAGEYQVCEDTRATALELAHDLLRDAVTADRRAAFLDEVVAATQAKTFPAALLAALEQQSLS